jgi:peptide/nickel transport system substrate-binding protein
MWLYYYSTQAQLLAAQSDPNLGLITVAGSFEDMLINPSPLNATASATLFNPFSVVGVRTAVNFAIDRGYIASQIYGGAAFPQTAVESSQSPEYARNPVFFASVEAQYAYNPAKAKAMVTDALTGQPNVAFTGGQWTYKGAPIVIQLLARVEDQRHQIGDYVAAQLRALGFQVNEQVIDVNFAINTVYNGDPTSGAWMAYTEGFGTTGLTAWPDTDPFQFYCGGQGDLFFKANGGLYSPPVVLNDACDRLRRGLYVSVADRQSLFQTATSEGIKESVRVWLAAGATFPYNKKTTAPFVYDLAGGPWSMYATRSAQLMDASGTKLTGGTLNVGNRRQFSSNWEPWSQNGFSFLYDILPFYAFADLGTFPDPHTGLYLPIRSKFAVTTAGPTDKLDIPATAYVFNATKVGASYLNTWQQVGAGKKATSKVVYDFTFGPWHDGAPMSMDDVLYAVALTARLDHGDLFAKDSLAASSAAQLFELTFRGLEKVDATHLAVYLDYWHVDPTVIAATGDGPGVLFPSTSWDESELAMRTVLTNWTAVDKSTGNAKGIPGLDLSKGRTIGFMDRELASNVTTSGLTVTVPAGFGATSPFAISVANATARWAALGNPTTGWRFDSGTYYSSNGPYFIHKIDTTANSIELWNFDTTSTPSAKGNYPYFADHWESLIVPKVPATALSGPSLIITGEAATFNMTSTLQGAAYDSVSSQYIVLNPATNSVVASGQPTRIGSGKFQVNLSGAQTAGSLGPGAFTLETITVGAEAAVPSFSTASFIAISQVAYIKQIIAIALAEANQKITSLQGTLNTTNAQLATAQSTINSLTTLLYVSIGVAALAVVVAAVSFVALSRRIPKSRGGGGTSGQEGEDSRGPEEL